MATTLEPRHPVTVRRFRPALNIGYQQELLRLVTTIAAEKIAEQLRLFGEAIHQLTKRQQLMGKEGVPSSSLFPTVAYATALRLLRDLVAQGWAPGVDDEGVFLLPPEASSPKSDPGAAKTLLRQSFSFARSAQLGDPATARFIRSMERRGISVLFENGAQLAERLKVAEDPSDAIQPVLVEVTPEGREELTGLRLQDVWRYARHLWSIPYQSTPGRNMFYLVRDAGSPHRPIIGIAALGNAVLGLNQRDEAIGWTVGALTTRLRDSSVAERLAIAKQLEAVLRAAISQVYSNDFDLRTPFSSATLAQLAAIEQHATHGRTRALEEAGNEHDDEYYFIRDAQTALERGNITAVDWEKLARTNLYTRKRAATLASLIGALLTFEGQQLAVEGDALLNGLTSEAVRRAADVALRQIKVRAIAENMMEIITCGAVSPYGEVLGGKLVAMLLTSPRVARDFRLRYTGRVSLIASAMKAGPVYRNPQLVLLTTSSLYAVGSSQYNRIKIPTSEPGHEVEYELFGKTDSFGTVHIGPDTAEGLREVVSLSSSSRTVNHLFGEGISPKLRSLRTGLDALGLESDVFLRHHSPRLLYGVRLCSNSEAILLGQDVDPEYLLGDDDTGGASRIAQVWRKRWLVPRLKRDETFARLKALGDQPIVISKEIPSEITELTQPESLTPAAGGLPIPSISSALRFVERLYRSANSYADRLTQSELEQINIDLGLEDFLLDRASHGKQVIVTGNPGDGKTHLIERLRSRLESNGVRVITDANAMSDQDVLATWRTAAAYGSGFVLAINEWPLFVLRRLSRTVAFPPVEEAMRQVQNAIRYTGAEPTPPQHNVVVIDLSLRNLLAPPVIKQAIARLTHDRFYVGLHEGDPALMNREALQNERVQERLISLLGNVARRSGRHVTMRQLVGFVAYLITGGQSAVERIGSQGSGKFLYANLGFEGGEGDLFDQLRHAFDPASLTHPLHDLNLWRGITDPNGWLNPSQPPIAPQQFPEEDRERAFVALKRRFFFEHLQGADLLALGPSDDILFERLLSKGQQGNQVIVRDLLLGLNRFFEPEASDSGREELQLWQSHRFDVRPPATFVALEQIPHRHFRIEVPKYASWVSEWLPEVQQLMTSFALVATDDATNRTATLIVDRDLYLTLSDSQRGLGRATWAGSATRRITRFVDRLHRLVHGANVVSSLRIRDTGTGLERKVEVQRAPPRFLV